MIELISKYTKIEYSETKSQDYIVAPTKNDMSKYLDIKREKYCYFV